MQKIYFTLRSKIAPCYMDSNEMTYIRERIYNASTSENFNKIFGLLKSCNSRVFVIPT